MPDLESLVQGREVGERCSSEVVQRKVGDPNFVGNFSLTFTLPGTLVCLSFTVLRCIATVMYMMGEIQVAHDHRHTFLVGFCLVTFIPNRQNPLLTLFYIIIFCRD